MSYPIIWRALKEMFIADVLHPLRARGIMRKSGFLQGIFATASVGTPILSVPPKVAVKGCPRMPYGLDTGFMNAVERAAFWEDVRSAEAAEPSGLDGVRDWLVENGYEDFIVMNGVMPVLGYDYAGQIYTLTLDEGGLCPIEIDIVPPDNGFWEQYKDGDERFVEKDNVIEEGQNYKWLTKLIRLTTGEAEFGYKSRTHDGSGDGYTPCSGSGTSEDPYITHVEDVLGVVNLQDVPPFNSEVGYIVEGWSVNYDVDGELTSGILPVGCQVFLTNDDLLDEPINPFHPTTNVQTDEGVVMARSTGELSFPDLDQWGFQRLEGAEPFQYGHYAYARWRLCDDPESTFSLLQDNFPALLANDDTTVEGLTSTFTHRDRRVIKEGYGFTEAINWSGFGSSILRYEQGFETFDVVEVRVGGRGPAMSAGSHLYP